MTQRPKFNIDAAILWDRAEASADVAASFLLMAAQHLRNSNDVPLEIVEPLAGAIEAAMLKPQKERGKSLLLELRLTALNRRPVDVDWFQLGRRFDELTGSGHSHNEAASIIGVELNISESSAKRRWQDKYMPFRLEHEDLPQDEERDVGPR
jgi:hypothetical protein